MQIHFLPLQRVVKKVYKKAYFKVYFHNIKS